jgi:Zn-dependent metalloprotease
MIRIFMQVLAASAVVVAVQAGGSAQQPSPPPAGALRIAPDGVDALRAWDAQVDRLVRTGELRRQRVVADTILEGHSHERLAQFHEGIPVFGADVTRQIDGVLTTSIFGTFYSDIEVDTMPRLSAEQARQAILTAAGPDAVVAAAPALTILPRGAAGYTLCYQALAITPSDELAFFVNAHDGQIVLAYSSLKRQAAQVGRGTGVLGDAKKLSVSQSAGTFVADDRLRPPAVQTYDMHGDPLRTLDWRTGRRPLTPADLAFDGDNDWDDPGAVDAHAYGGWVYDFYYKRFGRRGLDDRNLAIVSVVNPIRRSDYAQLGFRLPEFFANAQWSEARRAMIYGVGLPRGAASQDWNFTSGALDIVAHELTHGVTQFSSSLVYLNESGALNEAFSDMMGTSAEFFYQAAGTGPLRADYLVGEDVVTPGGIRSMQSPQVFGDPDHRALRCCVGAFDFDGGGVHINSGIPNNAFFLAIEGGRNSVSGMTVQGVGAANREQIEKIFYRAFTFLMPASADFLTARSATVQAARDLYGANSAPERAVTQAWDAVGVAPRQSSEASVWPNPVPGSAGSCGTASRPSWTFVSSVFTAQTPITIDSGDVTFYDVNAQSLGTSHLTASNFAALYHACGLGTNRLGANAEACAYLCISLGGRPSGGVRLEFNGTTAGGSTMRVATPVIPLSRPQRLAPDSTSGPMTRPSIAAQHGPMDPDVRAGLMTSR